MDLTHAVSGRPRWGSPEIVPDAVADYPYIGGMVECLSAQSVMLILSPAEFWNWCILQGCRPIIKAGRLFEKQNLHKQYK